MKRSNITNMSGEAHSLEAQQAYEELKKVIDYLLKIFSEIGCSDKTHITPAVSICLDRNCYTKFLCNECLTLDFEHTSDHKKNIIPIKQLLEKIFLDNMDDYILKEYKMMEVTKFYELFWKGIKMFYKERYERFVEDIRNTMKFLIDGFTEIVVKTKNLLMEKFDNDMRNIKNMIDQGVNVINKFNSFNVDKVVKDILTLCSTDKTEDLATYLRDSYNAKRNDELFDLPIKLYKNIMELKEEVEFADYTPDINFKPEKLAKNLLGIFEMGIKKYLRYIPPKKKLNYEKALKPYEDALEDMGFGKGLTSVGGQKDFAGEHKTDEGAGPKVQIIIKSGKRVVKQYEYNLKKFEKLAKEMGLVKFMQSRNLYVMNRQTDKRNVRRNMFKKIFPKEQYDKRWVLDIVVPKKKRRRMMMGSDDDAMSMLSMGGAISQISEGEGESLEI
jgi:hypothetical protein